MNELVKKCLVVGGTLSLVAGGSALLIGVTNAITSPIIQENSNKKLRDKLGKVFEDVIDIKNQNYQVIEIGEKSYIQEKWLITNNGSEYGYIYHTYGKNSYGDIDVLIGLTKSSSNEYSFHKLVELNINQTYKTTLIPNYVDKINNGSKNYIDTKGCGATFGANLIKSMIQECLEDASGVVAKYDNRKDVFASKVENKDTQTFEDVKLPKDDYKYIKQISAAYSETNHFLGYIYNVIDEHGKYNDGDEDHDAILSMNVGIYASNIYKCVVLDDTTYTFPDEFNAYLNKIDASNYKTVSGGASYTEASAKKMLDEIFDADTILTDENLKKVYPNKDPLVLNSDTLKNRDEYLSTSKKQYYIQNIYVAKKDATEIGYIYYLSGYRTWENEESENDTIYESILLGLSIDSKNQVIIDGVEILENTSADSFVSALNNYFDNVIKDNSQIGIPTNTGATNTMGLGYSLLNDALNDFKIRKNING